MPSFLTTAGRALARHLAQLRQALEDLTRRLQHGVAAIIDGIADEAAQEAVHALLGTSTSGPLQTQGRSTFWDGPPGDLDQDVNHDDPDQPRGDSDTDDLAEERDEQAEPEASGWASRNG